MLIRFSGKETMRGSVKGLVLLRVRRERGNGE